MELVNFLKMQEGNPPGGSFSVNEHFQVIARMTAPSGYRTASIHVIGVDDGRVCTYPVPLIFHFRGVSLDPTPTYAEGDPWSGPLCGTTYRFAAPGNTRKLDEVWIQVDEREVRLSHEAGVSPYPPNSGPLAVFLAALRRQLPNGGRFRVNEHGRAFTSDEEVFIGVVPPRNWFGPLSPRS
ncbi:MAG TPA: hypothetical protein VIX12_03160 [Candidatus Binataceae bacterium]